MMKTERTTSLPAIVLAVCSAWALFTFVPAFAQETPAPPDVAAAQQSPSTPEVSKPVPTPAPEAAPAPAAAQTPVPDTADAPPAAPAPQLSSPPAAQPPATLKMPQRNSAKTTAKASVTPPATDATYVPPPVAAPAAPAPVADSDAQSSAAGSRTAPQAPALSPVAAAASNPEFARTLQKASEYGAPVALSMLICMCIAGLRVTRSTDAERNELMRQAADARKLYRTKGTMRQDVAHLEPGSAFRHIAESSLRAFEHSQTVAGSKIGGRAWVASVIRHSCENVQGDLQQGLSTLSMVGLFALLVGGFGLLCGIYVALTGFSGAAHPSLVRLAIPLGSALASIVLGVAVAVLAFRGRERLYQRNDECMEQVRSFCADLRLVLYPAPAARAPMPMAAAAS